MNKILTLCLASLGSTNSWCVPDLSQLRPDPDPDWTQTGPSSGPKEEFQTQLGSGSEICAPVLTNKKK